MTKRNVAIIGAELDLGAGRRGVDMGPSAIRYAGLGERLEELGVVVSDRGNVVTALQETVATGNPRARFLDEVKRTCEAIAARVATRATIAGYDEAARRGSSVGRAHG